MLQDRGYEVLDPIATDALEHVAMLYARARQNESSLAEACLTTFKHKIKPNTFLTLSCFDRNYDQAKGKDRMISTDQVKYMQEKQNPIWTADTIAQHMRTTCSPTSSPTSTSSSSSASAVNNHDNFNGPNGNGIARPKHTRLFLSPNKLSPQSKKELCNSIELFLFDDLLIWLTRHNLYSPHIPVSLTQVRQYLGSKLDPNDLPKLPVHDVIAKWFQFEVGTIVFVDIPTMPTWRIVV